MVKHIIADYVSENFLNRNSHILTMNRKERSTRETKVKHLKKEMSTAQDENK